MAPRYYSQRAVLASLFLSAFFILVVKRADVLDIVMRPSSLGGGRILRRTLSVRLSVCLSVCLSVRPVIISERHVVPPSELK